MNRYLEIKYEASEIAEYIVELLSLGLCDLFLPAGFVDTQYGIVGTYQTEGFRPLASVAEFSTEEILSVAIRLLHGAYQSEKHCIFAGHFRISADCLFVDQGFQQVRMVFRRDASDCTFCEKLAELLETMQEKGCAEGATYIDHAAVFLRTNRYGYKAQLSYLENLRREVYLCGVK